MFALNLYRLGIVCWSSENPRSLSQQVLGEFTAVVKRILAYPQLTNGQGRVLFVIFLPLHSSLHLPVEPVSLVRAASSFADRLEAQVSEVLLTGCLHSTKLIQLARIWWKLHFQVPLVSVLYSLILHRCYWMVTHPRPLPPLLACSFCDRKSVLRNLSSSPPTKSCVSSVVWSPMLLQALWRSIWPQAPMGFPTHECFFLLILHRAGSMLIFEEWGSLLKEGHWVFWAGAVEAWILCSLSVWTWVIVKLVDRLLLSNLFLLKLCMCKTDQGRQLM
jgi:hypothetical protein